MGNRSRARGQRPPSGRAGQRIKAYHGTIATAVPAIRRHGLIGHNKTRAFITTEQTHALDYALRAVRAELAARGLADQPQRARLGAVVALNVDASAVICDPSHPTEYALTSRPPEWVTGVRFVDVRGRITNVEGVHLIADRISQAHDLEASYQDFRLGHVSDAVRASQARRWAMESESAIRLVP